jgi:Domain of unknown function (DUF4214)
MNLTSGHILGLIREQIKYRQSTAVAFEELPFAPLQLPGQVKRSVIDLTRTSWSLGEMMQSYDRQFVQNAYIVLLKRDPDVTGLNSRREALQAGTMSRLELLIRLRYGPEGKLHKVQVRGLLKAFAVERLCAIPAIGIVPRTLRAIAYLPKMQAEIQEIKATTAMLKNDSDDKLEALLEFQNAEFEKVAGVVNRRGTQ